MNFFWNNYYYYFVVDNFIVRKNQFLMEEMMVFVRGESAERLKAWCFHISASIL